MTAKAVRELGLAGPTYGPVLVPANRFLGPGNGLGSRGVVPFQVSQFASASCFLSDPPLLADFLIIVGHRDPDLCPKFLFRQPCSVILHLLAYFRHR